MEEWQEFPVKKVFKNKYILFLKHLNLMFHNCMTFKVVKKFY